MVSVIIAAHNEESVIGACIDALHRQTLRPLEIVVSANGCGDRTAEVAKAHGATVVERVQPGKAAALNAAERVVTSFPRLYLDADIFIPPDAIALMVDELASGACATMPRRRLNSEGRTPAVRAYAAINERLPAFHQGLFGRGVIMLSDRGRSRFETFPELIADDLFLDSLFDVREKSEVNATEILVETPLTSRELLNRLVRVRRGNTEMRAAAAASPVAVRVQPSDRWAWLRDVVIPEPRLAGAAVPYVALTLLAGLLARRPGRGWARDEGSRARAGAGTAA